ncbi:phosphatidate cytidylyltransferase [Methylopila capsulata]|uniref:Phosphatidate cytidylyltransferase n=1 Tax=Methylopila capsulata TaxID=61654 RepID=A0A9W6MRI4_9HYPH|nr:phosphatidate cytidylyltransferase [Methylopila capsulata]MBM7849909.1 phosphatidate cytidylyltransferase [Methylopila capsulata]GLK55199.1 phosphatidate cytidylyltransferase [Methylopila capsulata]
MNVAVAPGPRRSSELALRIVSGAVMAAAALAVAWLGGPLFGLFWTLIGVAVGVEWAWLATPGPKARRNTAAIVAVTLGAAGALFSVGSLLLFDYGLTLPLIVLGGLAAAFVARPAHLAGVAAPYGAATFLGVILLRQDPSDGLLATLWLFAAVWGADIGAFATGRTLGGPKLAPALSPKKTWSGAIGGAVIGTGASLLVARLGGVETLGPLVVLGFLATVATVIGDLFESAMKRRFGAKDSGRIIPGHGGLMDRMDGFLVAATLAALVGLARGGFDGAAQGLLRW